MKSSLQESAALLTERLARQDADLTASERALAEALGRDYPHALLESATALAARTGTSASANARSLAVRSASWRASRSVSKAADSCNDDFIKY